MEKERTTNKLTRGEVRKRLRILTGLTVASIVVTILTVIVCVVICLYYRGINHSKKEAGVPVVVEQVANDANGEKLYTQEEVDSMIEVASAGDSGNLTASEILGMLQQRLTNGDSMISILRDFYPEHIVLIDSGQYYFLQKDNELKQNIYDNNSFATAENGDLVYIQDEQLASVKGIDVSKYQGEIDWQAVKEDGVQFAIIRAGIRGYGEGKLVEDEQFLANLEGATAAGIDIGVYFFTEAISEAEAVEEAQVVLNLLDGAELQYPIYLDVEDVKKGSCRTNGLTAAERTTYAKAFLKTVEDAGYKGGIYGNNKSFLLMLDMKELEDYEKWLAAYSTPVYFPYDYHMLQYSEKGTVAGIKEKVDMNILLRPVNME